MSRRLSRWGGGRGHGAGEISGGRRAAVLARRPGEAVVRVKWAEGKVNMSAQLALFLFILLSILLSLIFKFQSEF